jgi:hypothetical protein
MQSAAFQKNSRMADIFDTQASKNKQPKLFLKRLFHLERQDDRLELTD